MAKKWMAVTVCLLLALPLTACGEGNRSYYEQAQLYLGSGEFAYARSLFSQLGEYEDAAEYTLYCSGLEALSEDNLDLARANFELVRSFKSSQRYLTYIEALRLEDDGALEEALSVWEGLGSFEDSADHAAHLREKIPSEDIAHAKSLMAAGRYEQAKTLLEAMSGYGESANLLAECRDAILRAAYDRAEALYASGKFDEALTAFEALGDNLGAAQRALDCRAAMYEALESAFPNATLSTASDLIEGYGEMEDYGASEDRLAELETRFSTGLSLIDSAVTMPWVIFGRYPTQETGAPAPVVWRLLSLNGATATLLCDSVIDALPATTLPALMLTANEQEALISLSLPLLTDLTALAADDLRCSATPYALASGVRHHTNGSACWWLGNPIDTSRNAVVWYNGSVLDRGVAATDTFVGMRPLIRVDLDVLELTEGNGSAEEPYQ